LAIDTSDFKTGMAFYMENEPYQILEFQHVKPGKGGAFVRTRLKRLKNNAVLEKTFRSGERFEPAYMEKRQYQFLYRQGAELILMDLDSYEQIPVAEGTVGPSAKYLKEESEIQALVVDDEILGYELPNTLELVIAETEPGVKGDTVSGGVTKPATLETGAIIQVPFHIKEGDVVKVDTRTDSYIERVNKK
jgi:elongation factor P